GGDVAFIAESSGGNPDGVFLWERATAMLHTVVLEGGSTDQGRHFCNNAFFTVGLGDSGAVGFRAMTRPSACGGPGQALQGGVSLVRPGGGVTPVALQDLPTPLPATTYFKFAEAPEVNATDQVSFRATAVPPTRTATFLWDPVTPTTVALAATGSVAPDT